jgi:hypothetical protein
LNDSRVAARAAILGDQSLVLGLVSDVRRHHLEDVPAEAPQLARPEVPGLPDEVGLGLVAQLAVEVGRQRVQRLDHHPHLGQVHVARAERLAHAVPPRVYRVGQLRRLLHRSARVVSFACQPRRGRPVPGGLGDVIGDGEHSKQLRLRLGDETRPREHRGLPLGHRQVCRVDRVGLGHRRGEPVERQARRGGHTSTQAPTTDTPSRSEPLIHKGIRRLLRRELHVRVSRSV